MAAALAAMWLALAPLAALAQGEPANRNEIFQIQFRLNQLGFSAGEPDGSAGPQTKKAAAAFAAAGGDAAEGAMTAALLARLEEKTRDIEGWKRADGTIDFLVFTDEGTPLIFKVIAVGQIHKSPDTTYVRDRERDGSPIYSNSFRVSHMSGTGNIPLAAGSAFGYRVQITPPPRGQRLQIDHIVFVPEPRPDGKVDFRPHPYQHVYLKRPGSTKRYWYWHFERTPSTAPAGTWRFALTNRGQTLISRDFELVRP